MTSLKRLAAACLVIILGLIAQPAFAVANKIAYSDATPEIELGASTVITLTLDQPIICPSQINCDVMVDFSGSLPQGLEISPRILTWSASEWSQPRTITVSVDSVDAGLAGLTTAIGPTVTSASEYYSGFSPTLEITVPATADLPVAYDHRDLANTGSNDLPLLAAGLLLVGAGIAARKAARK